MRVGMPLWHASIHRLGIRGWPASRPGRYFHLKWTKTRPKLSESFSTRW